MRGMITAGELDAVRQLRDLGKPWREISAILMSDWTRLRKGVRA